MLSRLTSMYGSILQRLATDSSVRSTLMVSPPLMTLAPSIEEVRSREAEEAGEEWQGDLFLW